MSLRDIENLIVHEYVTSSYYIDSQLFGIQHGNGDIIRVIVDGVSLDTAVGARDAPGECCGTDVPRVPALADLDMSYVRDGSKRRYCRRLE